MEPPNWSRREMGAAMALVLAGCARSPPILVNLAGVQDAANPPGAEAATGADLAGRVTAPVRINGRGPFDFVVDTGANRSVVSTELAVELSLGDAGSALVHGIVGVETTGTVTVEALEVGAVTVRRLRAPTLSRARLGADGLLGVDMMRDREVTLDFVRGQLRINRSSATMIPEPFDTVRRAAAGPAAGGGRVAVPARYRFGQLIIIEADVAGAPITAFLDSGSQSTVGNRALRRLVLGDTGAPAAVREVVPLLSATGQTATGELAELPRLRIGGLRLDGLKTVFADLHVFDVWGLRERPTILIGVDVMKAFDEITLDFARKQVMFTLPTTRRSRRQRQRQR